MLKNKDEIIKVLIEYLFNKQNCPPGMCEKYKKCTFKKEIAINCWIDWAKKQAKRAGDE